MTTVVRRMAKRFRPLVLCYHAVSGVWAHPLAVTPDALESQIRSLLRRGYKPVEASAVLDGHGKTLHVTFDDGFRNVIPALDMLGHLGVRATVFACTSFAVDGRPFDAGKLAPEAAAHPSELASMTFDELRELIERGVEVGSHTATHPRLTELGDAELRLELRASREQLEDELRIPCRFVAYPFGAEDARVRAAARDAGYLGGFALPGCQSPVDPFRLPRVGVYRKDVPLRLALKTSLPGRYAASARGTKTPATASRATAP